jgi:hypothetical protein
VERSATLGNVRERMTKPAFSGRKNDWSLDYLSPAKAGWIIFLLLTQGSARFARFTLG